MVIAILREVSVGGHAWKLTVSPLRGGSAGGGWSCTCSAAKLALRPTGSALNQGYQGIDKMGSLDVSAIPTKLAQAYGTVFNYFIADTPIYLTKLMRLAQGALGAGRRGCCRLDCGTRFRAQTGHGRGAGAGLHGGGFPW